GKATPHRRNEGGRRERQVGTARDRVARTAGEPEEQEAAAQRGAAQGDPAAGQRSASQTEDDDRRLRAVARGAEEDARYGHPRRMAGGAGEEGARGSEPAPRRIDRQEVHQSRPAVPRLDSGG